jgi:hypothetical protein
MKKRIAADITFDRIKSYYIDDKIVLSDFEENIRKRWVAAFSLILDDNMSDAKAVKILMKNFEISQAVAYRDLANCKVLFADARKASREVYRYLLTQWAIETLQMATLNKDFNAIDKMLGVIIKANNLDQDDSDIPDPSTWNPPTQVINIDYTFFYSEYAAFINDNTKKEFNKIVAKINKILSASKIHDYFQPFKTIDVEPKNKTNRSSD